jgi:catechol 2,3-dioxygenase-like lactoylglutathione lyase family enzyme
MFDHVKFGVRDYAASKAFFLKALEPLGVATVSEGPPTYGVELSAALEAGGKDNGAPGLRPHYHANYYAAFVIGPDGHNIEVVCHEPEA